MLATAYWQYETIRFLAEKAKADLAIKDQVFILFYIF